MHARVSKRPELLHYIISSLKRIDMRVLENGYANLPNGTIIELSGKSLADIVHVRTRALKEGANVDAKNYDQFSVGGRSFTIQDSDAESIELLKDKTKRKTLASVKLEATSYDRPVLDAETQEPTGETMTVKSFRFVSLSTLDDAMAYIKSEGTLAQEETKWAPKAAAVSQANIDAAVNKSMNKFMDTFLAKFPAPAAAPVAAAEETIED
jgi:hypothetical protein